MIGRATVVAALAHRLPQRRFVTIVGPGGIGKTTVAMAAADHLLDSNPHGICFVDLASITDPLLVSGTVAAALGLATISQDPLSNVIEFLKHKQMLIVLDSCERVVEAAAQLAEKLLGHAPSIQILATSREPLRARSEWVLRLREPGLLQWPGARGAGAEMGAASSLRRSGRRILQFVTSPPKIDGKTHGYDWHHHAKLIDKPESFTSIACEWSTDALNIKIVTRVSDSCHPDTSRFQTQPSVNKRIGYYHNRKTNQCEPERLSGTGVIVTPDHQREMPHGPHRAA